MASPANVFAQRTFGHAELGDHRRTRALVALTAQLARTPAGRITEVFKSTALRERAYRFVENGAVSARALLDSISTAFAERLAGESMAYVVLDGSSLTLADPRGRKDFGHIGSYTNDARGLKVVTAFGLDQSGVPLGIAAQSYWARRKSAQVRSHNSRNRGRKVHEKETQRWLDVTAEVLSRSASDKLWFIVDREGDSRVMLQALAGSGARFTVRSSWNRALVTSANGRRQHLRTTMAAAPTLDDYQVDVPSSHGRRARVAQMRVRAKRVRLLMKNRWNGMEYALDVNVVWAREVGTTPAHEKPLDWMLFTNAPVSGPKDALAVIHGYKLRWRVEDFHKTWKSGHCNVENTQLHSMHAATIFAIMHAAVAARAERLKHLSRAAPDQSAANELNLPERQAIAALAYEILNEPLAPGGRRQTRLVQPDPDTMSLGEAVLWIARFGGYTGKSSGGPPGAIVISRGLEEILVGARVFSALNALKRR